jgi:hypothetical protein
MKPRFVRYDLTKMKDCVDEDNHPILAFTIKTTDGEDESQAAQRAESKGPKATMTEELIRISLVSYEVEGQVKPCSYPFEAFDKWSTKARNFVVAAWKKLATPDDKEIADFFASATDVQ